MKKINYRHILPFHLDYLFRIYLLGIVFTGLFRLLQFLTEHARIADIPATERLPVFLKAFWIGFRFDTVISGYILLLPFLLLSVFYALKLSREIPWRWVQRYLLILYGVVLAVFAIDIPYFHQFFSRFSMAAFQWVDSPEFIAKMIIQEPRYFWTLFPYMLMLSGFYFLAVHIYRSSVKFGVSGKAFPRGPADWLRYGLFSLLFLFLLFTGIRGRLAQKSPIRVGTAYFSPYAFPNQLGLNPVFTFIRSALDAGKEKNRPVELMEPEEAIALVKKEMGVSENGHFNSPIARFVPGSEDIKKPNVVLVLMESMGMVKTGRAANPTTLTPHLDSLAAAGWAFDSIFTAGIHTYNGVYSTLFSYPALFEYHPLKEVEMQKYHGLPNVLKEHGYQTIYFTTHDDQFDNIGGFLANNGIDRIVAQKDYPSGEVRSTLGVPDDYLFRYSLPILDDMASAGQPFLSVFMTASDHGPYVIPEYFTPRSDRIREQAVEYSDWSIGQFMKESTTREWFGNTLFVFIADHGAPLEAAYDMPLNYHHTPLVFYGREIIEGSRNFRTPGGQIDVFPTLMGMLGLPYINNTLGIDLARQERPYIYFCADDKYGVLDDVFYLVVRKSGGEGLYRHQARDLVNYIDSFPGKAEDMKRYASAHMQTTQWMISNRKTGLREK